MTISVISNIMNIVGNAILIFGFHMGVAGAAIASVIAQVGSAVAAFLYLMLRYPFLRLSGGICALT